MAARTLVNLIAIAMVAGGMVRAWRATHDRIGKRDAPGDDVAAAQRTNGASLPWESLQREAERVRRRTATDADERGDSRPS